MSVLKLPRITSAERTGLTPAASEMLFDTTLNKVFIGDGATIGGVEIVSDISFDDYTLLSTTASISGSLQSQIYAIEEESTTIASSGGSIIVSQDGRNYNIEVASAPIQNHNQLDGLQGVGGDGGYFHLTEHEYNHYITNSEVASISGSLQSQIDAIIFSEPILDNQAGVRAIFDDVVVGESVAFPDLLYLKSDGKWWKADADAAATMPGLRLALASGSANATVRTLVQGRVRDDDWNWTVGGMVYASTDAGALTQTIPSGAADVVQIVGVAYHADKIIFSPSPVTVEIV
jgi:hypothetical protein